MKRETALRRYENLIKEAKNKFPDKQYKVLLDKAHDLYRKHRFSGRERAGILPVIYEINDLEATANRKLRTELHRKISLSRYARYISEAKKSTLQIKTDRLISLAKGLDEKFNFTDQEKNLIPHCNYTSIERA